MVTTAETTSGNPSQSTSDPQPLIARSAEIWSVTLAAHRDGVDVWLHGDLAEGHPLLGDGQLAAVIDFGTCGVGDPACDLAIA